MSKVYSLKIVQQLPVGPDEAWNFFSNPKNLQHITPGNMGFNVISKHLIEKMYPSQIIEYTVKPLLSIALYWMTEITDLSERQYFIDEQRFGPYSLWHHQHHFKTAEGGVEMTDIVHYKIPFWFLGDIANSLIVKKPLPEIFDFHYPTVERLFGNQYPKKKVFQLPRHPGNVFLHLLYLVSNLLGFGLKAFCFSKIFFTSSKFPLIDHDRR
jgi:ligand-binding SRPBCC domain-containing protein